MTQRLWAPWRMKYILEDCDKTDECFLCAAAESGTEEDRPRLILHRGEHVICVMNKFPYNNGHLLVAPKAHKADLCDLTADEQVELMQVLCLMEKRVQKVMNPDGFNIGVNLGKVSGAGLPGHLHFHMVPRWAGDTNFMPVLADTKVIPQALEDAFDALCED